MYLPNMLMRMFVHAQSGKWDGRSAQFRSNRKYVYVGLYGGAEDGAAAYERAVGESNSGHSVSSLSPQVRCICPCVTFFVFLNLC